MSITIGTAATTRSLSTAAVVHATSNDASHAHGQLDVTYSSIHAKEQSLSIRDEVWKEKETYLRSATDDECLGHGQAELLGELLHCVHGANRCLKMRVPDLSVRPTLSYFGHWHAEKNVRIARVLDEHLPCPGNQSIFTAASIRRIGL